MTTSTRVSRTRLARGGVRPRHAAVLPAIACLALTAAALGQGETLLGGLNAPMGVALGTDGTIYVVDSGTGGDQALSMKNPDTGETMEGSYGSTARVLALAPDGTQSVLAMLPSVFTGFDTSGGAGLALVGGTLYATASGWVGMQGVERPPLFASIVRVEDGDATLVADTWAFEEANNPDGFTLESHPYRLAAGADGTLWVTEAGANELLRVDPATGAVTLVTVFAGVPGPMANPARGGAQEMDPVPTGLVALDDGSVLVAFLPGQPFPPGSSRIVRVAPDGTVSDYADGLTMTTDLRMGPDGALYAVQFGQFTQQGPVPGSGALVRVKDGAPETVIGDLSFPTSVAFTPAGDALVTVGGVGAPGSGALVRFAGVAAP